MRHRIVAVVGTWLLLVAAGSGCTPTSSTPPTPVPAAATAPLPSAAALVTAPAAPVGTTALATGTAAAPQTAPSGETGTAAAVGGTATGGAAPAAVRMVEPAGQPPQRWAFTPATLQVKVGMSVVWTNTGSAPHTATADAGKAFDSGLLAPQATFRFTPTQAGMIAYHCSVHPWMKGMLVVQR